MTSQQQLEAAGPTATAVPMQGVAEGFVTKPNIEKTGQAQVDADIFDALFSKWGQDAAAEEANIGSSFDDLLWDEGTAAAAAAAAAASLGWQRSCTPFNLLSSSKAMGSDQQQQQLWDTTPSQVQQQQQDKQFAREYLLSSSLVASGPSDTEQDMQKPPKPQPQQSRSAVNAQPTHSNSCSDAQGKMQNAPALQPPAVETAAETMPKAATGPSDLQYSVQAMQQLLAGSCAASVPASAEQAVLQPAEGAAAATAGSQHMLNALNTAQQQLNMQQLQFSAAFSGVGPAAEASRVLPQLSMQAMLHLQQQMLAGAPVGQPQALPPQQPAQQPQQAHQQQQPVPMNSMFSYQLSAQQLVQQAPAAAVSSWPSQPATAAAGGMGAAPGISMGGVLADTALQASAWQQQQQQQQVRSAGLPAGLPFPGAGPGPGPGVGLFGNLPLSAPFGFPPLPGAHLLGDQAALYAAAAQAAQQPAAWQTQQQEGQQASLSAAQFQATAMAAGSNQNPLIQQSLSALLGALGSAAGGPAAAAPQAGRMGPPPPHAPNLAAANATATANGGAMLPLPQQQPHVSQLLQPMLPPDLLGALGLGAMGQGACGPAGAAGLGPLFPNSWQLQLAGLLRPPPVHTTGFLQLAMMMQAAMQASALSGGADTQQAALVVAALQGLACNMRMMMPWSSPPAWQQQPQQQQLNGSCLGNGPMLHRQLSSSFGIGGQKATMQFGSQPQTSTTDISGQGLPGCHSHSTAVAGYAAATPVAAGGDREKAAEPAHRSKQKRKVRHNDNRSKYEGRKMRANNRMRIKGRFVKMGPNGEPILPGETEAAEAEQHTAVTHSDHDVSDAELSDPETHEQPGSSGRPPATATLTGTAAGGSEQAGHTADAEPLMPPAGDTAELAVSGDSPRGPAAASAGARFMAVIAPGAADSCMLKAGNRACCTGAAGACHVCRASPTAGDRPRLDSVSDGGRDGHQAPCCCADRALGHANDGPCCCDQQHRSTSPAAGACAAYSEGCATSSTSGLGAMAEGPPGDNINRLLRPQQWGAGVAASSAGAQSLSNCSEPHVLDVLVPVPAAEVAQQGKRPLAALSHQGGELLSSSSKRQAVEVCGSPAAAAVVASNAPGAPEEPIAALPAAAAELAGAMPEAAECTSMQVMQHQQRAAASMDPAEAAAAMVSADVVEQQHQILVRQASEAAAAEAAAVTEAAAVVPDTDHAVAAAPTAASPQYKQLPHAAAVAGSLPAAAAAQPAAVMHSQPPAAALLNHLAAAGGHPALQHWNAVQAVSQVLHPSSNPVPAHLPGSMQPPASRPPAGVWGHNGVAALGALSAVHAAVRPGLAASAHMGMQLPASVNMLAGTPFAAMQPPAAPGLGPGDGHGLHMGLAPWALQSHMIGPGQHLLSPASSLAAAAVGMAGLPLVRPGNAVVGGGQPMLGAGLVPVALPGGWPLAAAVAGKWAAPRVGRQRRRGGKNAKEGSEQTDSCLN